MNEFARKDLAKPPESQNHRDFLYMKNKKNKIIKF